MSALALSFIDLVFPDYMSGNQSVLLDKEAWENQPTAVLSVIESQAQSRTSRRSWPPFSVDRFFLFCLFLSKASFHFFEFLFFFSIILFDSFNKLQIRLIHLGSSMNDLTLDCPFFRVGAIKCFSANNMLKVPPLPRSSCFKIFSSHSFFGRPPLFQRRFDWIINYFHNDKKC